MSFVLRAINTNQLLGIKIVIKFDNINEIGAVKK